MATVAAIHARHLVVQKEKSVILNSITLTVKKGSITGLIGPSGSGKTTLMRAIVGLQKFTGELSVLGLPAGSKDLRRRIGYVTQAPAIYEDLTVEQNVSYFASLLRAPKAQVHGVIDQVHLTKRRMHLAKTLSGGEKVRASLAVALLGEPELLILDEPTVGLDPLLRHELWDLFGELASQGKTILVSSHVMDEADRCDSLTLLRDGHLLWNDSREDLLKKTNTQSVEDAFIGVVGEKR